MKNKIPNIEILEPWQRLRCPAQMPHKEWRVYSPRPWKSCRQTALSCQHQGLSPLQSTKLFISLRQPTFIIDVGDKGSSSCPQLQTTLRGPPCFRALYGISWGPHWDFLADQQMQLPLCFLAFLLASLPFHRCHLTPRSLSYILWI